MSERFVQLIICQSEPRQNDLSRKNVTSRASTTDAKYVALVIENSTSSQEICSTVV